MNNSLNLHKKITNSRILVVVVKLRHRAIVLLDIQLKFTFSKSLSQQLLPLHRPQLSLQFLFIQIILSPAVHCPSIAQEGHFKSLSLHSWITGQKKIHNYSQVEYNYTYTIKKIRRRTTTAMVTWPWLLANAAAFLRGSLSYLPLQALFDFSFTIQNPDGNVSN